MRLRRSCRGTSRCTSGASASLPAELDDQFAVILDDEVIGAQDIAAFNFADRRTVNSGSWLTRRAQGNGVGTEMRAALLLFAFDTLGAEWAESSAAAWNTPSLAVSYKLGYEPNGVTRVSPRSGQPVDEQRVRLSRVPSGVQRGTCRPSAINPFSHSSASLRRRTTAPRADGQSELADGAVIVRKPIGYRTRNWAHESAGSSGWPGTARCSKVHVESSSVATVRQNFAATLLRSW